MYAGCKYDEVPSDWSMRGSRVRTGDSNSLTPTHIPTHKDPSSSPTPTFHISPSFTNIIISHQKSTPTPLKTTPIHQIHQENPKRDSYIPYHFIMPTTRRECTPYKHRLPRSRLTIPIDNRKALQEVPSSPYEYEDFVLFPAEKTQDVCSDSRTLGRPKPPDMHLMHLSFCVI